MVRSALLMTESREVQRGLAPGQSRSCLLLYKMLQFRGYRVLITLSCFLLSRQTTEPDHSLKEHLPLATFILRSKTGEKVDAAFSFTYFTPKEIRYPLVLMSMCLHRCKRWARTELWGASGGKGCSHRGGARFEFEFGRGK